MTIEAFMAFYPQFAGLFPEPVLEAYLAGANARFASWEEDAEEGRRLYMAHRLTMYARSRPAGAAETMSWAALAAAGDGARVTGKRVDDVSLTYAAGGSKENSAALADLAETRFGQELTSLIRLHGGPVYVP